MIYILKNLKILNFKLNTKTQTKAEKFMAMMVK